VQRTTDTEGLDRHGEAEPFGALRCVTQSGAMAELHFFTGTMDSGKSTLALQTNHNHAARGRVGRIFTTHDRAGEAILSSRLGLTHDAIEVEDDFDFWRYVVDSLTAGARVDYLICDEAQFYTTAQIDQLAKVVDELQIDVFAFGILSDFRTRLFPGSARLVELADRMNVLQVEALCWCGKRATHNARTEDGVMVVEGEVIVVGDVDTPDGAPAEVAYEVLCRQHHRRRLTAARAQAVALSPEPLPFGS
jgi:thymidine kinase